MTIWREEGAWDEGYKDKKLKRSVISTKRSAWRNLVLPQNGFKMFFDLLKTLKVPTFTSVRHCEERGDVAISKDKRNNPLPLFHSKHPLQPVYVIARSETTWQSHKR